MADNHPHPKRLLVPIAHDQQPSCSNDDSIMVTLQNSSRQIHRLQLELAVKADEYGISESVAHCLQEIRSASESLLVAMGIYEAKLPEFPSTTAHISPVEREEISLGKPVPRPKLLAHQEKELAHFLAEFDS